MEIFGIKIIEMDLPDGMMAIIATRDAIKQTRYVTPDNKLISEYIEYHPKKVAILMR